MKGHGYRSLPCRHLPYLMANMKRLCLSLPSLQEGLLSIWTLEHRGKATSADPHLGALELPQLDPDHQNHGSAGLRPGTPYQAASLCQPQTGILWVCVTKDDGRKELWRELKRPAQEELGRAPQRAGSPPALPGSAPHPAW